MIKQHSREQLINVISFIDWLERDVLKYADINPMTNHRTWYGVLDIVWLKTSRVTSTFLNHSLISLIYKNIIYINGSVCNDKFHYGSL